MTGIAFVLVWLGVGVLVKTVGDRRDRRLRETLERFAKRYGGPPFYMGEVSYDFSVGHNTLTIQPDGVNAVLYLYSSRQNLHRVLP